MSNEFPSAGAPDPFALAADMLDPPGGGVEAYYDDPVEFVRDCIRFDPDQGPTDYQERVMRTVVEKNRVCVRGPHSLGKTTINCWMILWFSLTRDARGVDWKLVTTASTWRQLEEYLWPDLRTKWVPRVKWGQIGRPQFSTTEMQKLRLVLDHGHAFAAACEDPAKIEGAHADSLMFIYDESKTIPAETFDATEGAFMGAGTDGAQEAFALATSTPGESSGRFYDIQTQRPGTEDWTPVAVSKAEVIAAGRMGAEQARNRERQWGADSAMYIRRVEGNFAADEATGIIRPRWVEEANERWMAWAEGCHLEEPFMLGEGETGLVSSARAPMPGLHARVLDHDLVLARQVTCIGMDVAESGGDKTIMAIRWGNAIGEIRECPRGDVIESANYAHQALSGAEGQPAIVVDANSVGAGTAAKLRELGDLVVSFKGQERTDQRDASRELEMYNLRVASYWHLRDLLDPANGHGIMLPPDDELLGDLVAIHWKQHPSGKIIAELKAEIKERLGRSPDRGDAVAMAFWHGHAGSVSAPVFLRRTSPRAPMRQTINSVGRASGSAGRLARVSEGERPERTERSRRRTLGWVE